MADDNWYYVEEGNSVGPVDKATLRKRFQEGLLKRDSLVWQEGSPDWVQAGEIPGLIPPPIPQSATPSEPPARLVDPKPEPKAIPASAPEEHVEPIIPQARVTGSPASSLNPPVDLNDVAERAATSRTAEPPDYGYAGFWRRFAAIVIDWIIHFAIMFVLFFVAGLVLAADGSMETWSAEDWSSFYALANCSGILIWWLYFAGMECSRFQGTLGKMAIRIKVTDLNGDPIGFGRATGRHFGKIVSALILGIGFLMAAFTPKKQALHDLMAGCLVLNK